MPASSSRSRAACSRAPRCRATCSGSSSSTVAPAAFRHRSRRRSIELPNNRVNLVFEVTEGPKTGVSGITFIGNQAFGDARLRNVIETRRSGYPELPPRRRHLRSGPACRRRGEAAPLLSRPRLRRLPGRLLGRRPRSRAEHVLHHLHGRRGPALPVRRDLRRFQHPGRRSGDAASARSRPTRATSSPAREVEQSLEEITLHLAGERLSVRAGAAAPRPRSRTR